MAPRGSGQPKNALRRAWTAGDAVKSFNGLSYYYSKNALENDWRCAWRYPESQHRPNGGQLAASNGRRTGEYATTSEIVREAVRDWQFKRELRQEEVSGYANFGRGQGQWPRRRLILAS